MKHPQSISGIELIWNKTLGCYCEFGLKETLRRLVHEILVAPRKSAPRLDISMVTDRLAIGASPKSHAAIRQLLNMGFKHIIDLRAERKKSDILLGTIDILVNWVPTYDNWKPKPDEFFSELVNQVNYFLACVGSGKLFICCDAGEHRAPLGGVLALAMMGYPLDTAIVMIHRARPVAELLPVYLAPLRKFLESKNRICINSFVGSIGGVG